MSNMITVNIKGFKELEAALKAFPIKVAQMIERKATLAGAAIVRDAARSNFDSLAYRGLGVYARSGLTRKKIRARKLKTSSQWMTKYGVGISRYGMFVELGTKGHSIAAKRKKLLARWNLTMQGGMVDESYTIFGKKVEHPGTGAKPFLRPAFYNNIERIIEAERRALAEMIEKENLKRA